GEDVVQETLLKAMEAAPTAGPVTNPEGWLFRIAHHAALDLLRRRAREEARYSNEDLDLDMIAAPRNLVEERQIAAASLRTFMRLPVSQRNIDRQSLDACVAERLRAVPDHRRRGHRQRVGQDRARGCQLVVAGAARIADDDRPGEGAEGDLIEV